MKVFFKAPAALALAAAMLVPASAAYAAAEPRVPKKSDTESAAEAPDRPLGAGSTSGDVSTMAVELMPANCWGKSNDPHNSTHYPGKVAGQGMSYDCDYTVPQLAVEVQLWDKEWWGGYDQEGVAVYRKLEWVREVRASDLTTCHDDTWRTTTFHTGQDRNLRWYSAETIGRGVYVNCP